MHVCGSLNKVQISSSPLNVVGWDFDDETKNKSRDISEGETRLRLIVAIKGEETKSRE